MLFLMLFLMLTPKTTIYKKAIKTSSQLRSNNYNRFHYELKSKTVNRKKCSENMFKNQQFSSPKLAEYLLNKK